MQLQTSPTECQQVVCYDPQKRSSFKQLEVTNTPVEIQGANYSPNKRNATQMDLTIKKKAKTSIKATVLDFNIEPKFSNRLINVSDIPSKSTYMYDVIDLKIKVISKNEEKQKLIVRGSPCFKTDAMVSDDTGTVRLELWENAIDEVQRGKSYHLQNLKVKIFDDIKYVNTCVDTKVSLVEDVEIAEFSQSDFHENIIEGKIIGVDVARNPCCLLCNPNMENGTSDDMITFKNCHNSFLSSMIKSKLVCKLVIQINNNFWHVTAFNDALESFLSLNETLPNLTEILDDDLSSLF